MDRSEAEEHLRVIRALMEKATIYRTISAPTALVGGLCAVAAGAWLHTWDKSGAKVKWFFGVWFTVLFITALANTVFIWNDARRRREPFISAGMRKALFALLPAFLTAAVLTGALWMPPVMPGVWMLCYGLGLLATAQFAPRSIPRLGWCFLLLALLWVIGIAVDIPKIENVLLRPNLVMAVSFGGLHLLYAACTWWSRDATEE
jgi:hypothetical protein